MVKVGRDSGRGKRNEDQKESEPGGGKRTEIGLEGKKEKIDAILRQAGEKSW